MGQPGPSRTRDEPARTPNLVKINVTNGNRNGPERMPLGKICPLCNHQCRYHLINQRFKVEACTNVLCNYPFRTGELNLIREEFYFDEEMNRRRLPDREVSEQETRKLAITGTMQLYRSKIRKRRLLSSSRDNSQNRRDRG